MGQTGFGYKIKIQDILDNQIPEQIHAENPKFAEFLQQYYISQEIQGGSVDIIDNLVNYLKLDNLTPDVISGSYELSSSISSSDTTISVSNTKGFPDRYGLLKIGDEIITYKSKTTNSFVDCVRGFSGIVEHGKVLTFSSTNASSHDSGSTISNLSVSFLNEIYKNIKFLLLNELDTTSLSSELNVNNFIKNSKSLYQTKGTKESIRILFNALYGITPQVLDLENFVAKLSNAKYVRRSEVLFQAVSGDDPQKLIGQEISKNTDSSVKATVSEIEIYTRKSEVFYKFLFFIGFSDDTSSGISDFETTPTTKVVHNIQTSDNTNTLTVDTTVNFPESGSVFYNNTEIFYTAKSLNQFFGCYTEGDTYINLNIPKTSNVYSSLTYFGYEEGDTSKKVTLRLIGTISNLLFAEGEAESKYVFNEDQTINVGNFGEIIGNPNRRQTLQQVLANSLIYNTSTRYELNTISFQSNFATILTEVDFTSLKVGDRVEFLQRNTEILVTDLSNVTVTSIDFNTGTVEFSSPLTSLDSNKKYDIRRVLDFASSNPISLKYDNIASNIINLYQQNDDNYYIASNSLPGYLITKDLVSSEVSELIDYDTFEKKYETVKLSTQTSLLSGDKVYYSHTGDNPIGGLVEGEYYITVSDDFLEIKLYTSLSSIPANKFIYLSDLPEGTHKFTLNSQKTDDGKLYPQKLFKKIRLNGPLADADTEDVGSETVGVLANGVEIKSYKSPDIFYYGPIDDVDILNTGENFDVVNPPQLSVGVGTAKIEPVVRGSIKDVIVLPHNFEVEEPINLSVTGGNGKNVSLKPITRSTSRDVFFNARTLDDNGGLSIDDETISFLTPHNFYDGQKVYYDKNDINNPSIGIGPYEGADTNTTGTLTNNSSYYVDVINDVTVQLYPTLSDYNAGINTVGFTTVGNFGIHKFKTAPAKVLDKIVVESGGEGFESRKLTVKPVGVSTIADTITFKNHGFSSGELVTYSTSGTSIGGLSSLNQYYILKVDDNSFRLSNAGVGGTDTQYYNRGKYEDITSSGSGYHYFNYPEIKVTASYVATASQSTETIECVPKVTGQIIDAFVYEEGEDYGSTLINVEQISKLKVLNGKNAELTPVVTNGEITSVVVSYYGVEYFSRPDLEVVGPTGTGAILHPTISNGRITSVTVISGGKGYTNNETRVVIKPRGNNLTAIPKIRPLHVNNAYRYGTQFKNRRDASFEVLEKNKSGELQYLVLGYQEKLRDVFDDTGGHSPIIGWAYDGNPIYGPFGYTDPNDTQSTIKLMAPSYVLDTSNVKNRLSTSDYVPGYFVEDYKYTGEGDLDRFNGRFCKTPEFPNGIYAYFATSELNSEGEYVAKYPYFVKNYRSLPLRENQNSDLLNQSFDFKNSNLLRNTNPYKEGAEYASYDFFITDKTTKQIISADIPSKGVVESFNITEDGDSFKINDVLNFEPVDNFGEGLSVTVSEIKGKEITSITTKDNKYTGAKFFKNSNNSSYIRILPSHDYTNNSQVFVSGLSTSRDSLNAVHDAFVASFDTILTDEVSDNGSNYDPNAAQSTYHAGVTGIVTDIKLNNFPSNVAIGGSIKITGTGSLAYDQYFTILNYFPEYNVIRARKTGISGISSAGSVVTFLPNIVYIDKFQGDDTKKENYNRYFNPARAIGVGTQSGTTHVSDIYIGENVISKPIPTRSLYIPNHGFVTRQEVKINKRESSAGINGQNDIGEGVFDVFDTNVVPDGKLYVIRKTADYIGIVTGPGLTTTSEGLYFPNPTGSDNHDYYFSPVEPEETCEVNQIISTVAVSTSHGLSKNDTIALSVVPQLNVGIGQTTLATVKYLPSFDAVSLKDLVFLSSDVDTDSNKINFVDHGLETGDKVYYISTEVLSGLSTNTYYVSKIDTNNFRLAETYNDANKYPPKVIELGSASVLSDQSLSLLSPKVNVIKNNNLVFDVGDSSLLGYDFKLYYDKKLTREFVSVGSTTELSVIGLGTVGVTTGATVTLKYSDDLPRELYYGLSNEVRTVLPLPEIIDSSKIIFNDSVFNNTYRVIDTKDTSFDIFMGRSLERRSYNPGDCKVLSYKTTSTTANGPVSKLKIVSPGSGYKNLPYYKSTNSKNGTGLSVIAKSSSIGNVNSYNVLNTGFEYSSDSTLKPKLFTDKNITLRNSKEITSISVTFGGRKYPIAPNLVIVDTITGKKIDNGLITAEMSGGDLGTASIEDVVIGVTPRGMPSTPVTVKAVDNANGIRIERIDGSNVGLMTCLLKTPILGFSNDPFKVGDKVFVEEVESTGGIGYNSADHGYAFFEVTSVEEESNPFEMEIQIPKLYGTPGVAVTFQVNTFATVIDSENYPTFDVEQDYSKFFIGESLTIVNADDTHTETDLVVEFATQNYIKVKGNYPITTNNVIRGEASSSVATIENIDSINGRVDITPSSFRELGWQSDSGKTNTDTQFISDNDYYQNLSYTIKSPKTWDEISAPLNSTVHTAGTKNFADTQIDGNANVVFREGALDSIADITQTFISQARTDIIKNFDMVRDFDVNGDRSKFLQFKNVKLANFTLAKTNRVLNVDDISGLFSSVDDEQQSLDAIIKVLNVDKRYYKVLVQVRATDISIDNDLDNNHLQLSEFILLNDDGNSYYVEKSTISNYSDLSSPSKYGEIVPILTDVGTYSLVFKPYDPYDVDYEIKLITQEYNQFSNDTEYTVAFGHIRNRYNIDSINVDQTKNITSLDSSVATAFVAELHIIENNTNKSEYLEVYGLHDGTDTSSAIYKFDGSRSDITFTGISTGINVSLSNNTFRLSYTNYGESKTTIRSKVTTFEDPTTLGIGTYRFKSPRQQDFSVKTSITESKIDSIIGNTTIKSYDKDEFSSVRGLARVSCGNTSVLHEFKCLHDDYDSYIVESPLLAINGSSYKNNSGIGTFGSSLDANNLNIIFYPDSEYVGSAVSISQLNTAFYTFFDEANIPPSLTFPTVSETFSLAKYIGKNSDFKNRLNFPLKYEEKTIFEKSFDPNDTNVLNPTTGVFTITDHFFSNGERLIYTPDSTFIGIGKSSLHINTSTDINGISTDILPRDVFAIKLNNRSFKIATNYDNAISGIGVTFPYLGIGNAHKFEMEKKNEKVLIAINDLVQYPILNTKISHTLESNDDGQIGIANTYISLSGISSIKPTDLLLVDNEYMKVTNVGLGTTLASSGSNSPIEFSGDVNIVEVERGFVGSSATSHTDGANVTIYRGAYNIVGDEIFFTHPPRGSIVDLVTRDESNLERERSTFTGRVFLRQDYSSNEIYDDFSNDFDGTRTTFNLTIGGISTVGFGTTSGNGVLFINGMFQRPLTQNASNHNFEIVQDSNSGITSVIFSGIRNDLDELTISESDINQNQLPRGGIIVSLGSTAGLGYAPLYGSKVLLKTDDSGSITDVVGTATTYQSIGVTTASYDEIRGIVTITASQEDVYKLVKSRVSRVKLVGLAWTCTTNPGIVSFFPYHDSPFDVVGLGTLTFSVDVGISTLKHFYSGNSTIGFGTVHPWHADINFGSGYRSGNVTMNLEDNAKDYVHKFVSATPSAVQSGGDYDHTFVSAVANGVTSNLGNLPNAVTDVTYDASTGDLVITSASHGLSTSNTISIADNALSFTCTGDNNGATKTYPRSTDPASGASLAISAVTTNTITVNVGTSPIVNHDVTFATYNPSTGVLVLTIEDHGLSNGESVGIYTGRLTFTCSSDNHVTKFNYPRETDPLAGIITTITATTSNTITVNAGRMVGSGANITATVGAGGTLAFNIVNGGSGYTEPVLNIEPPVYENLEMTGVSRLGVGETTDTGIGMLMNVKIGQSENNGATGIGTTMFEVSSFNITRNGYAFQRGDVIEPVGLVTAAGLSEPLERFQLYVLDTYNDNVATWQFGEMNLIDSVIKYQNGKRTAFPLYYNGEIISFQKDLDDEDSQDIDFNTLLVIFINGILQQPNYAYEFNGGSAVRFLTPPKANDDVQIYFYVGTRGVDSKIIRVNQTIKIGDSVQVLQNNDFLNDSETQDPRLSFDIFSADILETSLYTKQGVDDTLYRPLNWIKQKEDLVINETNFPKTRDSIEPQIYPTAKVIKDINTSQNFIFVDDTSIFNYEDNLAVDKFNSVLLPENEKRVAIATATVSSTGTITSINLVNGGVGYSTDPTLKISNPIIGIGTGRSWYNAGIGTEGDVGIGTTAVGIATVSNGSVSSFWLSNAGSGYTSTNPPQIIISEPETSYEVLSNINVVRGFSGGIVGIGTTVGIGTGLGIKFELHRQNGVYTELEVGNPIYIFDTHVGTGLTSIETTESDVVGISTQFIDNIYTIHAVDTTTGIITCNISDQTSVVGLGTTGTIINPVGQYSWGKLSGFSRSTSPISIGVSGYTVSGLSSFPTIQRRGFGGLTETYAMGLRDTGSLDETIDL